MIKTSVVKVKGGEMLRVLAPPSIICSLDTEALMLGVCRYKLIRNNKGKVSGRYYYLPMKGDLRRVYPDLPFNLLDVIEEKYSGKNYRVAASQFSFLNNFINNELDKGTIIILGDKTIKELQELNNEINPERFSEPYNVNYYLARLATIKGKAINLLRDKEANYMVNKNVWKRFLDRFLPPAVYNEMWEKIEVKMKRMKNRDFILYLKKLPVLGKLITILFNKLEERKRGSLEYLIKDTNRKMIFIQAMEVLAKAREDLDELMFSHLEEGSSTDIVFQRNAIKKKVEKDLRHLKKEQMGGRLGTAFEQRKDQFFERYGY